MPKCAKTIHLFCNTFPIIEIHKQKVASILENNKIYKYFLISQRTKPKSFSL